LGTADQNAVTSPAGARPSAASAPGGRRFDAGRFWLAGFVAAMALYLLTLAPDLVWQDSGDYQYEAARLNLSRPGDAVRVHPWFIVVAHVLGWIPLWDYAYAANLASAIGTAIAVANVLLLVRLVTGRTWAAAVAAVAFGVGHAVWAHAVVAETYGWAAAFLSTECLCAWMWLVSRDRHYLVLLFVVNGLAISNHLMAVLSLAVFAAWVLIECMRHRVAARVLLVAAVGWIIGGTLYWIVLAMEYARSGSLAETLRSATVGQWGSRIFNLADLPALFAKTFLYVALNYPTPLIAGIFLGGAVLVRRCDTFSRLVLLLAAAYFLWAARYNVVDQYAFFIPFYVLASVAVGVWVAAFLERRSPRWAWALLAAAVLPVAVYAVLPAVAERAGYPVFPRRLPYRDPYVYFLRPWRTCDTSARRYAREVLDSLPPDAVLAPDSTARPPLVCLHDLEGCRPDVTLDGPQEPAGRRLFVTSDVPGYFPSRVLKHGHLEEFGLVWEVRPPAKEGGP
jgi:hypothetical protein